MVDHQAHDQVHWLPSNPSCQGPSPPQATPGLSVCAKSLNPHPPHEVPTVQGREPRRREGLWPSKWQSWDITQVCVARVILGSAGQALAEKQGKQREDWCVNGNQVPAAFALGYKPE